MEHHPGITVDECDHPLIILVDVPTRGAIMGYGRSVLVIAVLTEDNMRWLLDHKSSIKLASLLGKVASLLRCLGAIAICCPTMYLNPGSIGSIGLR